MKAYTGNSNSLADCILELLFNNNNIVETVKLNAMRKVHEMYNWDIISDNTYAVYKEVIEEYKNTTWENTDLKEGLKELNDKKVLSAVVETKATKKSSKEKIQKMA